MRDPRWHLVAAVLALAVANSAIADDGAFYLGGGLAQYQVTGVVQPDFHLGVIPSPPGPGGPDLNDVDWKLVVGYRPVPVLGIEVSYSDLGKNAQTIFVPPCSVCFCPPGANQCNNGYYYTASTAAKAGAVHVVGLIPLPLRSVAILAKAGVARWSLRTEQTFSPASGLSYALPPNTAQSERGTSFSWGVGAQLGTGRVAWRVEYERFAVTNTDGASAATISLICRLY